MIVHGIDYNHNGLYDNVLDRSDLNNSLPGEATAPAICGSVVASQTASTGGSADSTRTYAFVLDRRVAASSTLASNLALACDLLGADVGDLSDRRIERRDGDLIRRKAQRETTIVAFIHGCSVHT